MRGRVVVIDPTQGRGCAVGHVAYGEQGPWSRNQRNGRIWWLAVGFLGVQLDVATYDAFLPLLDRDYFDSQAVIGLLFAVPADGDV